MSSKEAGILREQRIRGQRLIAREQRSMGNTELKDIDSNRTDIKIKYCVIIKRLKANKQEYNVKQNTSIKRECRGHLSTIIPRRVVIGVQAHPFCLDLR